MTTTDTADLAATQAQVDTARATLGELKALIVQAQVGDAATEIAVLETMEAKIDACLAELTATDDADAP